MPLKTSTSISVDVEAWTASSLPRTLHPSLKILSYFGGRRQIIAWFGLTQVALVQLFFTVPGVLVVVGVTFVGMLIANWVEVARAMTLLKWGEMGVATLVDIVHRPNKASMAIFDFIAPNGETHRREMPFSRKLSNESQEPTLFNPDDPSRFLVLDELASLPRLVDMRIVSTSSPLAWAALLAPLVFALSVGAHLLRYAGLL